jgi:hypothetical protein
MATSARASRIGLLPVLFWAVSCMDDPAGGDPPLPAGESNTSGYFRILLAERTEIAQGQPTVEGRLYSGAQPKALLWAEKARSGACALYLPKIPFCDPGCGSGALCVSDGVCKPFAKPIQAGTVALTGVKTKSGATSLSMDATENVYQPKAGANLEYVPFAEGDEIKVSAAGDTALGSFSLVVKAIARLAVLNDTLVLADGQPIALRWTPPVKDVGSAISVLMDLSHHGGSKGRIECETEDDGSLDIAASLLDSLKALGVSGWPQIDITRKVVATHPQVHVDLEIKSPIARILGIPGLTSCTGNEDCPTGKTCQEDLQCK